MHYLWSGSSLDPDADPVEQLLFENLFKYEWVQTRSPAGAIRSKR